MTTLFDAYIAVDWSARSTPGPKNPTKDSVWVGECGGEHVNDVVPLDEEYFPTRDKCVVCLRERLAYHVTAGRRVFVGFDFPYGYPRGYATSLGIAPIQPHWRLMWTELFCRIVDCHNNFNNRFEVASDLNALCGGPAVGPFWGCPAGRALPLLRPRKPPFPFPAGDGTMLQDLRIVEQRVRGVQSAWKLWGNGSVGGQSLVGIPRLHYLRFDPELASVSHVWPFETGFGRRAVPTTGPFILHAEIWPGVVTGPLENGLIRDQAQVRTMVRWLRDLDATGTLGELFDAPTNLSPQELAHCTREEGWILGVR